jgi:thiol-disulfide isomerase/thioredoxin
MAFSTSACSASTTTRSVVQEKTKFSRSSSQRRTTRSKNLQVVNAAPPTGNERRAMESAKVAARTNFISSAEELDAALTLAGDNLVMLGIISDEACEGFSDSEAKECRQVTASMARIARECPDVTFLECDILSSSGAKDLADKLGIKDFPTFQYYKHGDLLWQHSGFGAGSHESIAEGVLYYGDEGAGGLKVQDFLTDIETEADLKDFLELCMPAQEVPGFIAPVDIECSKQLAIVDVSVENDPPTGCLKIFPAVVSLSRNTAGATRWARLTADKNKESKALAKTLKVTEVPSFVFFADGKEVDRYTGSDRMALMNKVLAFQRANGVKMPQKRTTKRMTTAEAREIARKQREEAKKAGRSQWS